MNEPNTFGLLGALQRAEIGILTFMKWAIIFAMVNMIVAVTLQIGSRYLLPTSLSWTEEVARLSFICVVFLGAAVLARREEHLTVNIMTDLLPDRLRHLTAAFATLIGLICARYMVEGSWITLMREWDQRTPALQIPMGLIFGVIFASSLLMLVWLFVVLMLRLRLVFVGETA